MFKFANKYVRVFIFVVLMCISQPPSFASSTATIPRSAAPIADGVHTKKPSKRKAVRKKRAKVSVPIAKLSLLCDATRGTVEIASYTVQPWEQNQAQDIELQITQRFAGAKVSISSPIVEMFEDKPLSKIVITVKPADTLRYQVAYDSYSIVSNRFAGRSPVVRSVGCTDLLISREKDVAGN